MSQNLPAGVFGRWPQEVAARTGPAAPRVQSPPGNIWAGAPPPESREPAPFSPGPRPVVSAPPGTREFRQQVAEEEKWVESNLKRGGTLEGMGLRNEKGEGQRYFSQYGPGGLYSTYGAGVDPNWEYDWISGQKRDIATSDPTARDRWIPITEGERQGYAQAEQFRGQFGEQASYADFLSRQGLMGSIRAGHVQGQDPATGLYWGDSPGGRVWFDQFGRKIGVTQGPGGAQGGAQMQAPGAQGGGLLPDTDVASLAQMLAQDFKGPRRR